MTKSEVENAIKVVMSDVIDECYRRSSSFPTEEKKNILQIANEAEMLLDELMIDLNRVKQKSGYSIHNPKIIEIKERLNKKSLDYLGRLQELEHH